MQDGPKVGSEQTISPWDQAGMLEREDGDLPRICLLRRFFDERRFRKRSARSTEIT
jgi:hypothetical protein